ncbi:hypothetical protein DPMN_176636 [Dreissena polymorpha]|uniref:Uncharacterized protein n=2 Tax=Dreissena polymorpha TaxID=45954 RepID=A0A9D4IH34_DREPO|nr:hypothetical protein DPMN_176636 [Dreissena polymorpha]
MHHAYIDYIWETFRQRQRTACGVDPASDYPHAKYSEEHAAEHGMYGISSFKNKEGMADFWIKNWYNYTDTPTCANNCSDSPDLYCDKDINLCASQSRVSFGDDGIGTIAPLKAVPQPQVIAAREMTSTPGDATSTVDVDDHIREGV